MKKTERRKISDIVEAFGNINQDIHSAFGTMCEFLEQQNEYKSWKKKEPGKQKTHEGYEDFLFLPEGYGNWYYLNFYGEFKGKVIGFAFVIAVGYGEEDKNYFDFIQILDKEINLNTPMLLIYGIYTPAGDIRNAKLVDENSWNYVDEILRITEGWKNFDENLLSYKKWIDVEVEYDEQDDDYLKKTGWYKSARVKILPITNVDSEEKAEEIVNDLMREAKSYQ